MPILKVKIFAVDENKNETLIADAVSRFAVAEDRVDRVVFALLTGFYDGSEPPFDLNSEQEVQTKVAGS